MATEHSGNLIAGEWVRTDAVFPVHDKFTGEVVRNVGVASEAQVTQAVASAAEAFERTPLAPYRRYEILSRAAEVLQVGTMTLFDGCLIAESDGVPAAASRAL